MTILDKSGADKPAEICYSDGVNETRVQGSFISLDEITDVTDYIGPSRSDLAFSSDLKRRCSARETAVI